MFCLGKIMKKPHNIFNVDDYITEHTHAFCYWVNLDLLRRIQLKIRLGAFSLLDHRKNTSSCKIPHRSFKTHRLYHTSRPVILDDNRSGSDVFYP
jgi:hypothetical protein